MLRRCTLRAELNIDRLLRDVEGRLAAMTGAAGLDEARRREVMDALREAMARERLRLDPDTTVERERERRQQAEELRSALEAVHGSVRPEESLDEVLKQLERIVQVDFAVVAAAEPGGGLRVAAVRGASPGGLVGALLADPRLDAACEERRAVRVAGTEGQGALGLAGAPDLRSWVALPLLLEGDVVGLLVAGRAALDTFTDDELLRAKAVGFWAGAALHRALQLDQLRRYSTLLEQVVELGQRVFEGEDADALSSRILEGACRIGGYRGGLLVLQTPRGPVVAATSGEALAGALHRAAPVDLASAAVRRLPAARMPDVAEALGTELPAEQVFLVPLTTPTAGSDAWLSSTRTGSPPRTGCSRHMPLEPPRPGVTSRSTAPAPEPPPWAPLRPRAPPGRPPPGPPSFGLSRRCWQRPSCWLSLASPRPGPPFPAWASSRDRSGGCSSSPRRSRLGVARSAGRCGPCPLRGPSSPSPRSSPRRSGCTTSARWSPPETRSTT